MIKKLYLKDLTCCIEFWNTFLKTQDEHSKSKCIIFEIKKTQMKLMEKYIP